MANPNALPYWLDGGTEPCEFCAALYVLQAEYRCAGCDRGACEHCMVIVHGAAEVFCHECADAPEEG